MTLRHMIGRILGRKLSDKYIDHLRLIRKLGITSLLDIPPPKAMSMKNHLPKTCKYMSVGLPGEYDELHKPDVNWNLNKYPYPFKDNSFDMVLMSHILEHIENPPKAMTEGYRIAKRFLVINIPTHCRINKQNARDLRHIWNYDTHHNLSQPWGKYLPFWLRRFIAWTPAYEMRIVIEKRKEDLREYA